MPQAQQVHLVQQAQPALQDHKDLRVLLVQQEMTEYREYRVQLVTQEPQDHKEYKGPQAQ